MKSAFYVSVLLLVVLCGFKSENKVVDKNMHVPFSINDYMDEMLADGFDYPIGDKDGIGVKISPSDKNIQDSWRVSSKFLDNYNSGIQTGVDFCKNGLRNSSIGQPVFSIGKGVVLDAKKYGVRSGGVVLIKHKYLENGKLNTCFSLYSHLENLIVKVGDIVQKRQQIGAIGVGNPSNYANLHFEIRKVTLKDYQSTYLRNLQNKDKKWVKLNYYNPLNFLNNHRILTCPNKSDQIIIAIKSRYKMYLISKGVIEKEYEIALGQNPIGHKEREGDLKMPEGEYYVTEKRLGPFYGNFAEYLGSRYVRLSYPNCIDAEMGFKKGLLTKKEKEEIIKANNEKTAPLKTTKIGGGILIHGWNEEWKNDGDRNLTWGCLCMHNYDLDSFFDKINLKTVIIIAK
ncbi:MAG: peptidoglycan DD-metalloendopeptidase family protein [Bacteroidota bacterium]